MTIHINNHHYPEEVFNLIVGDQQTDLESFGWEQSMDDDRYWESIRRTRLIAAQRRPKKEQTDEAA